MCTDKVLADYHTRRLAIGRLPINTKSILLSYLSYLFRLRLLSEVSYIPEELQIKTKMHAKAKLQNASNFTGNRSQTKLKPGYTRY